MEELEGSKSEKKAEHIVLELNELKSVLGDHWLAWVKLINQSKVDVKRSRRNLVLDCEEFFRPFAARNNQRLDNKFFNSLQMALTTLNIRSTSDIYTIYEFFEKFRADAKINSQISQHDDNNSPLIITIESMKQMFKKAEIDSFQDMANHFKRNKSVTQKAEQFDQLVAGLKSRHEKLDNDYINDLIEEGKTQLY